MEQDSKELSEYSLIELQDKIEELYEQYRKSKDRSERKDIRKLFTELTTYYNKTTKFNAYQTKL